MLFRSDIEAGKITFSVEMEDIHMNIESLLIDRIGDVGKKLHTGRSRNDQVATECIFMSKTSVRLSSTISNSWRPHCSLERRILLHNKSITKSQSKTARINKTIQSVAIPKAQVKAPSKFIYSPLFTLNFFINKSFFQTPTYFLLTLKSYIHKLNRKQNTPDKAFIKQ